MALDKSGCGVSTCTVQKLTGSTGSLNLVAGTIPKTFPMPNIQFPVGTDLTNVFVEDIQFGISAGVPSAMFWLCAKVTGLNQVTLYATSLAAQTLTFDVEAKIVQYA